MFQGRLFSYPDTHRHRLGPNYLQIPVNCPFRARVANYQRDGPMCVSDNQGSNGNILKYNDTYACTAEFFSLRGGFKILTKQIILLDITYYAIRNATFSPQPFSVSCDFFPPTQTPLYNSLSFRLGSLFFFFFYVETVPYLS